MSKHVQAHLQETYMSEMAGPVAQQYFLEVKWDVGSIGVLSSDLEEDSVCMSFGHSHILLSVLLYNYCFHFCYSLLRCPGER